MAQAHVNHGRWIVRCTRCPGAEDLAPKQRTTVCTDCRQILEVEWPADADDIWDALLLRPVPGNRNWAPAGHRQTYESRTRDGRFVADVFPSGQTVADLLDENLEG